jgi:hypothetical protein
MTLRAVILGLLCGAFLCAVCFFNDEVIRQSVIIRCFLPVAGYGGLMLFVIAVNRLLRRVWTGLALTGRATYQRLRHPMFGFIADEVLAGLLLLLFGALYYAAMGQPPVPYRVLSI